jgi:6-phosphogluconolactonase (cycloisomerase 2 family)
MYNVDSKSGALASIGTIAAGTTPFAVTVDPTGRFAYVANQTSNDVSMYSIDPKSGALTALGTVPTTGTDPVSITIDTSGKFAYVANQINNVSVYAIDAGSGILSSTSSAPAGSEPMSVALGPSGKFAYVGDVVSNTILMFSVDSITGALTSNGTVASGMYPYPVYAVDSSTGALTPVGTIPAGTLPGSLAIASTIQ